MSGGAERGPTNLSRIADLNEGSPEQPDARWAAVQTDYVANMPAGELCLKHGVTSDQLEDARRRFHWRRRRLGRPVGRHSIIKRLFRLLDRQIAQMENEMTTTGEKEAAVLGRLVGTLGKLIEIEGAAGKTTKQRTTKEMVDIRNKLIRRIEELKRP